MEWAVECELSEGAGCPALGVLCVCVCVCVQIAANFKLVLTWASQSVYDWLPIQKLIIKIYYNWTTQGQKLGLEVFFYTTELLPLFVVVTHS